MTWPSVTLFTVGWVCGWVLLARRPQLPLRVSDPSRAAVAVVIPARNESHNLATTLTSLQSQLRVDDQIVVVDDHSTDDTAGIASAHGATVLNAPDLPAGWTGKSWACHMGAWGTTASTLIFLDADVALRPGAIDALARAVADRGGLVSVQPWHATRRLYEQLSLPFNIVAMMGTGVCAPWGRKVAPHVAFGPVLATRRSDYEACGGHAHPDVRGSIVDDIALARRYDGKVTITMGKGVARFRMYPDGPTRLARGWAKNIAAGASSVPWWAFVGVVAWLWSVIGAPGAGWPCWLASALQVLVLGRRVGRWNPLAAIVAPMLAIFFLGVLAWSAILRAFGWPISWRGREVATR